MLGRRLPDAIALRMCEACHAPHNVLIHENGGFIVDPMPPPVVPFVDVPRVDASANEESDDDYVVVTILDGKGDM